MSWQPRGKLWVGLIISTLVSPFLFFSTKRMPWGDKTPFFLRWGQELLYPMEAAWHTGVLFLNDTWRNYFYLVGLREENQKFQNELTLLQTKILDYDHQVNEVKRLRKLLNFSTPLGKQIVMAEIVGIVGHPPFQSIRVEKGADAGVRIGMPDSVTVPANGTAGFEPSRLHASSRPKLREECAVFGWF